MARRSGSHFVISAQFLGTGAPAYLTARGLWSGDLQQARVILAEGERDEWLARAAEQERLVCDPYCFEVRVGHDAIEPLSARERIRAQGPTTRLRRPDAAQVRQRP